MWTSSPHTQILLKASLSCASLRRTKQWSKWLLRTEVQRWDTCQGPTELRLMGWLTESIWTPRSKSNMQLADMLTKGNFTRDEWDHLLRLLNIMNFSMFSCSHFLSNRKQSVMSKRAQESTSKEGSAVAKPRPMNLVSRNLLSAKKTPLQDSSASDTPVKQEFDHSYVSPCVRKLMRNNNHHPTASSQERRQMTLYLLAPGNWGEVVNLQAQAAPGN